MNNTQTVQNLNDQRSTPEQNTYICNLTSCFTMNAKHGKILIVDDNESILLTLKQ